MTFDEISIFSTRMVTAAMCVISLPNNDDSWLKLSEFEAWDLPLAVEAVNLEERPLQLVPTQ